jgi:hypothetical protein
LFYGNKDPILRVFLPLRICRAKILVTEVTEVPPPPLSRELKIRWSHFIQKVYETDPLVIPSEHWFWRSNIEQTQAWSASGSKEN